MSGNFSTCPLSRFAWWDRFLPRRTSESDPFTFIRVRFYALTDFSSLRKDRLGNMFCSFNPLQVPEKYNCCLHRYHHLPRHNFSSNCTKTLRTSIDHCLCISVAPVCYAHLAAQQMGQFMKFEDASETSSGQNSMTTTGSIPVPELPRLHKDVAGSMFFCWSNETLFDRGYGWTTLKIAVNSRCFRWSQ